MICLKRGASSRRGRPRDPAIDARILSSALRLFGKTGWANFSIENAAKTADVSKATLYLRWRDKTSLLTDALHLAYPPWTLDDSREAEENLVLIVDLMIRELTNETGWALHRALRDPGLPVELRDCCRKIVSERLAVIDRLIDDLRERKSWTQSEPQLIRKALVGAAMGEAGDILLTGRRLDLADTRHFAREAVRLILAHSI